MRLAILICVGALFARPCSAQLIAQAAQESILRLSERDAIARFVASDPRIRALNARIDEICATQAERTLWPNPTATYSRESVLGAHDTFLLARQELPVSGRRSRLQTAGRLAVDAGQAEAQIERVQLQAEVREAYTALLLAQQHEQALQGSIGALQTLVSVLRTREAGGEGSTYDRMRGQRTLVDLEAQLSLAARDRAEAQGPPLPPLIAQALANRGDYRASELSIARFEAERAAAARLQIPTPTLTGGLKRSDLGGTAGSGYQFSVDLSIPLFSRGQAATALATAQKARAQAEAESSGSSDRSQRV